MASSNVLALGALGAKLPYKELKGNWLKYNNDRNYKVLVAGNHKSPQARYFSVCSHAPTTGWDDKPDHCCNAHLKAVGPSREEMTIISLQLEHKGDCPGGNRKRNYKVDDLATVSDILETYQPTSSKEGNPKQLINMTKSTTGFTIKTGQASKVVRSKSSDTVEAQIGQYLWIPSLIDAYKELDPSGTYHHEWQPCSWDITLKQFVRCYICLSIAKHFWKHAGIKLMVADGTHTRATAFKHIVLIVVTFDGNNQIVILAFAVVDIEDADNWVWFKEKLDSDFPGWDCWMSDKDKGIRSDAFKFSLSQSQEEDEMKETSRCTRHLCGNCAESCKSGAMNEDHKNMIISLAKARTEEACKLKLDAIDRVNEDWAAYLDARKEEFATHCFLGKGIRRFGKVTSNAVENINGALRDIRGYPIVFTNSGGLSILRVLRILLAAMKPRDNEDS